MESYSTVIQSNTKGLNLSPKELWRYRDLVFLFVKRSFITRYKQTILGPAWAIIQPLLTTVVFTFIFGNIAGLGAQGVPSFVFYFSGNMMWGYFSSCLTGTANTFISNRGILGKVYFPRMVMPVSGVMTNMITLAIQFVFFSFFLIFYMITGENIHPNLFALMLPVLVLQSAMLGLGVGVIISALTTKYRDLAMLTGFGVSIWMYATPIAYDMEAMGAFATGGKYHALYMLNPVTSIINIFRYGFLGIGQIEWLYYAISWVVTFIVLLIGIVMFNRVEKTFMDTI
ncbi:MAG: ABC transporter permease [Succiniclasticum sp.]|nr:ABC transporter permease [Succiniclasticum sp.]